MNPLMVDKVTRLLDATADADVTDLSAADAAEQLRQMERLARWAAARSMALGAHLADVTSIAEETILDPTTERMLQPGSDGTPTVSEFTICEIAALTEIDDELTEAWIGAVLNVRHRHPRMWAAVMSGQMPAHLSLQVAGQAALGGLDAERARWFDERFADRMSRRGWRRSQKFAAGLIVEADPELAERKRQIRLATRRVNFFNDDEQPGVRFVDAKLDTADAVRLNAAVTRIAEILADLGESATCAQSNPYPGIDPEAESAAFRNNERDARRARALGILASPARALALLQSAARADDSGSDDHLPFLGAEPVVITEPDIPARKTELIIHVSDQMITSQTGVARIEGHGPATWEQVVDLLSGSKVTVRPLIDLNEITAVDRYEIPNRMRTALGLRHPYDAAPFSDRPTSRSTDCDHLRPYRRGGPPGQTSLTNLAPTGRRWHRAKTMRHVRLLPIEPGIQLWTTRLGYQYLTTPNGTTSLGNPHRTLPAAILDEIDPAHNVDPDEIWSEPGPLEDVPA